MVVVKLIQIRFNNQAIDIPMDSSLTVSLDNLHQYMVNFSPMNKDYDCQVSICLLIQNKAYILFVINLIRRTKRQYNKGRRLKFCGTMHCRTVFVRLAGLIVLAVTIYFEITCPSTNQCFVGVEGCPAIQVKLLCQGM